MDDCPEYESVFTSQQLEKIREEYDRLGDLCYLDQIGCALYAKSYIKECYKDLTSNTYGNPHSLSIVSKHCTDLIDQIRYKVLHHFNTNVDEYSVVFTGGTSQSLKLVAESFKWCNDDESDVPEAGEFAYVEDNHTSVLGMRNVVKERGATVKCLSHQETLDAFRRTAHNGDVTKDGNGRKPTNSLFVYSAQCNLSGVKYPLEWIDQIHRGALGKGSNWYCLLDAASLVSTEQLDLSAVRPDFVCFSFYKIFGYPTGLGALLVKNSSSNVIEKQYYGGGTVLMALSAVSERVLRPLLHERLEDGTLDFLSIIALNSGFKTMDNLIGNFSTLSRHCFNLAKYTYNLIIRLHHANGSPAAVVYADTTYDSHKTQGGIVNFNMVRANGENIGYAEVLNMANMHGIQLRTGCFCNPGACRRHLRLSTDDVRKHYKAGHFCGDENDLIDGKPTGSVRVSFGIHNTKKDVDRLLKMLDKCFCQQPSISRWPVGWGAHVDRLKNIFNSSKSEENKMYIPQHNGSNGVHHSVNNGNSCEVTNSDIPIIQPIAAPPVKRQSGTYLSQIFLYPIKSCGRFSVEKWEMDERGLKYDRQWMVTTAAGVALTQKTEPLLCLLRPYIDLANNILRLTFKGEDSITVDIELEGKNNSKNGFSFCQSKVCGDRIQGYDCGEDVANWLSKVLKRPGVRLIRQLPEDTRTNKKSSGALAFSNQSQFLFINDASVKFLADRLEDDSDCSKRSMIDRFRSNFVGTGLEEAFSEQDWTSVQIGNVKFKIDGPCGRCQMICIDQDSGLTTKEPLTTLTATLQGKMKFGIYLSRTSTTAETISVHDPIFTTK